MRTMEQRLARLSKFTDFSLKKSNQLVWTVQLTPVPGAHYLTTTGLSADEALTKMEDAMDKLAARFADK